MKKGILVLGMVMIGVGVFGQAGNWAWARQGTGGGQEGTTSATDAFGNVYATGTFAGTSVTFGATTMPSAGNCDMFLVKYSSTGAVLWARSAGGNDNDQGNSVATDASGNVYVTGFYSSHTMFFGADTINNTGVWNMFIAKYSPNGNLLWVKSGEGSSSVIAYSVIVNSLGYICVTGSFGGTSSLIFGIDTLTNASSNYSSIFTVAYSASGTPIWAKSSVGIGDNYGYSITSDVFGNVFITGYYSGPTITFGTTTLTNIDNTGNTNDVFIAKYSSSGVLIWAKSAGGTSNDYGTSIATDASGNAYLTGYFYSSMITFGFNTLPNLGGIGMFLVKYSTIGSVLFAKTPGGLSTNKGWSVATDASGIYVTGSFIGNSIVFDSDTLLEPTLPVGATDPMFIVKYDSTLNVICASTLASGGDDLSGVSTDGIGNAYITGDITGANPIMLILGIDTLLVPIAGQELFFIAKYRCPTTLGITELPTPSLITLYPNPATNNLTITLGKNTKKVVLTITDITGKLIYTATALETEKMEVSTSGFAEGIYIVKIQTGDGVETKKLIVQK